MARCHSEKGVPARLYAIAAVDVPDFAVSRCPEGTRNLRNLQLDTKVWKTQVNVKRTAGFKSANKCRSCRETITSCGLPCAGASISRRVMQRNHTAERCNAEFQLSMPACHWVKGD